MKKVWLVKMTVTVEMAVVAEDREEAGSIARQHLRDEMENGGCDIKYSAREMRRVPNVYSGTIPWGDFDDKTVDEWVEGQAT